jgi:hypothetical protein
VKEIVIGDTSGHVSTLLVEVVVIAPFRHDQDVCLEIICELTAAIHPSRHQSAHLHSL